ncbi:MAG: (2Fe-2S)-binding protein [Rubrivivax sp.]|jgi:bacterioferritin-associated ferredoxin|nr:(2Fe-2S)-binding protein [Rubrivivax sp.]
MIVCVCHRISDRDIAHAAQCGCASFDELQFKLAVATCCGKCHDVARETFDRHVRPACAKTDRIDPVVAIAAVQRLVPRASTAL